MTSKYLQHIADQGEGIFVEFKTSQTRLNKNAFETVCAFLNRQGGHLLLGIEDDGTGSYSVVVKGLYNGEEFTFRSSEDFEINVDLEPALEFSETSQSTLVVEIFVPVWFMGADGMVMHPKEQSDAEKINENIENSFEAFEESFDD